MAHFGIKDLNRTAAKYDLELVKVSTASGNYFAWIHPTVEIDTVMVHSFNQMNENHWMKDLDFAIMQVNAELGDRKSSEIIRAVDDALANITF